MGIDYTLACDGCKTRAYVDRRGSVFAYNAPECESVELEWVPILHGAPDHGMAQAISSSWASDSLVNEDYAEDYGETVTLAAMLAFVAEHEDHGQVLLLSDGLNCTSDYASGWKSVDIGWGLAAS